MDGVLAIKANPPAIREIYALKVARGDFKNIPIDRAQGNWSLVFWVLAGLSLLSALLMVSIWNARPKGAK